MEFVPAAVATGSVDVGRKSSNVGGGESLYDLTLNVGDGTNKAKDINVTSGSATDLISIEYPLRKQSAELEQK